jgi:hypothetical protein
MWTVTATPAELALTRAKVAKINARAVKKGFTGKLEVVATKADRKEWKCFDETGANGMVVADVPGGGRAGQPTRDGMVLPGMWVGSNLYDLAITGEPPSYGGWTFIATLDWDANAGLIVRTAPGAGDDAVDRSSLVEGRCDQCGSKRQRKNTYLVRNDETGEQKQIGSTCIKDFLGWSTLPAFISELGVGDELEGAGLYTRAENEYETETVLAIAWAAVTTFGFVRSADPGATSGIVRTVLAPSMHKADRALCAELAPVITEAAAKAAELRAFLLSDKFDGANDYVINLKAIAGAAYCSSKNIGFLTSAPQAWARAQEKTLIRKAQQAEEKSQHFGEVGKRLNLTLTVEAIRYTENDWGLKTIYKLRTADGNIATWFTSSGHPLGQDVGTQFTVKATIKDHGDFNGIAETVLTRVAVQEKS